MDLLRESAKILKTSWCKGRFKTSPDETGEQTKFCSMGAMGEVLLNHGLGVEGKFYHTIDLVEARPEIFVLADVIKENYEPELIADGADISDAWQVVVTFNDQVAKSSDEVITMFEKAAVKYDERI